MTLSDRDGTDRGDTQCMRQFRASSAPDTIKRAMLAVVAELRAQEAASTAENPVSVPPFMLHWLLNTLKVPTEVGLSLLRVLHGWPLFDPAHSRTSIGAALRDKRRQLGRDPTEVDFPAYHPVPIMAWPYWGSIAAWAAAAPDRTQVAKGHWRIQANQEAALRDVAARFPGEALTHGLLHQAGYHALVVALTGHDLAALAARLGLDRTLAKHPNGWWTPERVMDAYADLCREAGVTLSSHALALMGGLGCTIRTQAAKHFDSFRLFQAAAARCHPDLRPAERPTAADGTVLGSWPEVVAYQAIRRAFPDVAVALQVTLPGMKRRSCDLVLADGKVWIEVLGMAREGMDTASSAYQRKYAANWRIKAAYYQEHGTPLVVIEPADIADPALLAERLGEVAALLGLAAPTVPAATQRSLRAPGTWDFAFLCQAVAAVVAIVGGWPTHEQLAAHGYGHAVQLLKQPGMAVRVSDAIGVKLCRCKGEWTAERVVEALTAWVAQHDGQWPTHATLVADGQTLLAHAIRRYFSTRQDELRAEVGRRCGMEVAATRMPDGAYATQASCAALLRPLCDRLGRFPTQAEMVEGGLPGALYTIISRRWGVRAMAGFMAVPYVGCRQWNRAAALAAFQAALPMVADLITGMEHRVVTCTAIKRAMGSNGLSLMQKWFGTIAGLRAALDEADRIGGGEGKGSGGA